MRMFKKAKFICSYSGYGKSYLLEKIHHHEMFECLHRSILCPAQGYKFINNIETVIHHSINCPFNLLYCAFCKSLCNVSVLTHVCNVIKSLRSIPSLFKYYHENPPANNFHKDLFLHDHSYTETFDDRGKINYDMFMRVALSNPHLPLFSLDEFFNAKMQLKIFQYLLPIIILTDHLFVFIFSYFYLFKIYFFRYFLLMYFTLYIYYKTTQVIHFKY